VILAVAGFSMHSVPILFVALFGFGVAGALFGPIKYGILPDLLQRSELPAANALSRVRPSWRSCSVLLSLGLWRGAAASRCPSPH
jgi:hypothetical protein